MTTGPSKTPRGCGCWIGKVAKFKLCPASPDAMLLASKLEKL